MDRGDAEMSGHCNALVSIEAKFLPIRDVRDSWFVNKKFCLKLSDWSIATNQTLSFVESEDRSSLLPFHDLEVCKQFLKFQA